MGWSKGVDGMASYCSLLCNTIGDEFTVATLLVKKSWHFRFV